MDQPGTHGQVERPAPLPCPEEPPPPLPMEQRVQPTPSLSEGITAGVLHTHHAKGQVASPTFGGHMGLDTDVGTADEGTADSDISEIMSAFGEASSTGSQHGDTGKKTPSISRSCSPQSAAMPKQQLAQDKHEEAPPATLDEFRPVDRRPSRVVGEEDSAEDASTKANPAPFATGSSDEAHRNSTAASGGSETTLREWQGQLEKTDHDVQRHMQEQREEWQSQMQTLRDDTEHKLEAHSQALCRVESDLKSYIQEVLLSSTQKIEEDARRISQDLSASLVEQQRTSQADKTSEIENYIQEELLSRIHKLEEVAHKTTHGQAAAFEELQQHRERDKAHFQQDLTSTFQKMEDVVKQKLDDQSLAFAELREHGNNSFEECTSKLNRLSHDFLHSFSDLSSAFAESQQERVATKDHLQTEWDTKLQNLQNHIQHTLSCQSDAFRELRDLQSQAQEELTLHLGKLSVQQTLEHQSTAFAKAEGQLQLRIVERELHQKLSDYEQRHEECASQLQRLEGELRQAASELHQKLGDHGQAHAQAQQQCDSRLQKLEEHFQQVGNELHQKLGDREQAHEQGVTRLQRLEEELQCATRALHHKLTDRERAHEEGASGLQKLAEEVHQATVELHQKLGDRERAHDQGLFWMQKLEEELQQTTKQLHQKLGDRERAHEEGVSGLQKLEDELHHTTKELHQKLGHRERVQEENVLGLQKLEEEFHQTTKELHQKLGDRERASEESVCGLQKLEEQLHQAKNDLQQKFCDQNRVHEQSQEQCLSQLQVVEGHITAGLVDLEKRVVQQSEEQVSRDVELLFQGQKREFSEKLEAEVVNQCKLSWQQRFEELESEVSEKLQAGQQCFEELEGEVIEKLQVEAAKSIGLHLKQGRELNELQELEVRSRARQASAVEEVWCALRRAEMQQHVDCALLESEVFAERGRFEEQVQQNEMNVQVAFGAQRAVLSDLCKETEASCQRGTANHLVRLSDEYSELCKRVEAPLANLQAETAEFSRQRVAEMAEAQRMEDAAVCQGVAVQVMHELVAALETLKVALRSAQKKKMTSGSIDEADWKDLAAEVRKALAASYMEGLEICRAAEEVRAPGAAHEVAPRLAAKLRSQSHQPGSSRGVPSVHPSPPPKPSGRKMSRGRGHNASSSVTHSAKWQDIQQAMRYPKSLP